MCLTGCGNAVGALWLGSVSLVNYASTRVNDLLRSATSAESPQMIADGRGRSPLETDPGRRSDHGLPAVQMPSRSLHKAAHFRLVHTDGAQAVTKDGPQWRQACHWATVSKQNAPSRAEEVIANLS